MEDAVMERHEQARSEYEHSASGVESADTVGGVTTSATDALDFAAKVAEVLEQQWSDLRHTIAEYTRAQPWTALVMAVGLGWLVGRITGTTRHRAWDESANASGIRWPPRTQPAPSEPD
jgi:hypothetical protein